MIPLHRPYYTGKEIEYLEQALKNGHTAGDGPFTQKCEEYFQSRWGFPKCHLTTSCTDALEMCALLIGLKQGDEVIVPSYTFPSTASAFLRQGAKVVFADSRKDHPGIDEEAIEELITPRTKAIVPVHYAGVACDMDKIMATAAKHKLWVVEDNAQGIDSYHKGRPLGGIGQLGCFSFHQTKNIHCGEGGLLAINDPSLIKQAEIIREKGTNKSAFLRGEVDRYEWKAIGSSFLPSDLLAACLWAQLEALESIQEKRKRLWSCYHKALKSSPAIGLPIVPSYATKNGHNFYLTMKTREQREAIIDHLRKAGIGSATHYQSLHQNPIQKGPSPTLPYAEYYSESLLRLPFFSQLEKAQVDFIATQLRGMPRLP